MGQNETTGTRWDKCDTCTWDKWDNQENWDTWDNRDSWDKVQPHSQGLSRGHEERDPGNEVGQVGHFGQPGYE